MLRVFPCPVPRTQNSPRGRRRARHPEPGLQRATDLVFIVTALGAFMASLDLSIVNVAFPALEHSFPHDSRAAWPGSSPVTASCSPPCSSPPAGVPIVSDGAGCSSSVWASSPGLGSVRAGPFGRSPHRRAIHPGQRRGGDVAGLPRPSSGGLPERTPFPGGGPVGWHRRSGRGHRAVARRAPRIRGRDGAGSSSSICPSVPWPTSSDAGSGRDRPGDAGARPTTSGSFWSASPWPRWSWASPRVRPGAGRTGASSPASSGHRPGNRLPAPVGPSSRAGPRPHPLSLTILQRGQCGHGSLCHGLLRHAPRQHPLSHERLALFDPQSRAGRHPRTTGGGRRLRTGRPGGQRIGFRAVLLVGFGVFAGGLTWYATAIGLHPAYVSRWLPATLITGLGIGLTFLS